MRSRRSPRHANGFVLILCLFVLTSLLGLTAVGLTRSSTEFSVSSQSAAMTQAFYLAEAGLDAKLAQLGDEDPGNDGTELTTTLDGTHRFAVSLQDQGQGIWWVASTGVASGISQRVQAVIRLPSPKTAFDYTVAGRGINLDGNATIGSIAERASMYVDANDVGLSPAYLVTGNANNIWASQIDFYNPHRLSLSTLCPNCPNASIFHPGTPPVVFNLNARRIPPIALALGPYYTAAVSQQTLGQLYHHLTHDTAFTDATLEGVVYVECGVDVTFRGTSVVHGTIVHEGVCANRGGIKINSNGSLAINSYAGTNPVAPGLAIIGAPYLSFGNTTSIDIVGFVMSYGKPPTSASRGGGGSKIAATGTIQGGLIGVDGDAVIASYPDLARVEGPGASGVITWPLAEVDVGGTTHVIFRPTPESSIPETPATSEKPTVLLWSNQ